VEKQVAGDPVVGLVGTGHGADRAGHVLVADQAVLLAFQIVSNADRQIGCGDTHARPPSVGAGCAQSA
jgi:hypothetical protein